MLNEQSPLRGVPGVRQNQRPVRISISTPPLKAESHCLPPWVATGLRLDRALVGRGFLLFLLLLGREFLRYCLVQFVRVDAIAFCGA